VSDLNDARLKLAQAAVPGVVSINPKRENVGDVVRDQTEGKVGCDVAIECVGNEHALKACVDAAVRKQGVVVQTGLHPHETRSTGSVSPSRTSRCADHGAIPPGTGRA
jgi:(R,R)-butanediol dehydrogenase/meso-butanediol dehydrogenase/diacetyl reductase